MVTSRSILLRMRNVSDKSCRENKKKSFCVQRLSFENLANYEIMWNDIVERGADHIRQYGACAQHAAQPRLHTHIHTHNL
jgi:hypothetical protein